MPWCARSVKGSKGTPRSKGAINIRLRTRCKGRSARRSTTSFGAMRRALHDADLSRSTRASLDALKVAAAAKPESYIAQLALGQALAKAGDPSGFAPLQRAAVLVPAAIGDESPNAIMAALAEKLGDRPRAIKEYRALLAADHANVEAARRLLALAEAARRRAVVDARARRGSCRSTPFDATAHTGSGRMALNATRRRGGDA